MIADYIGIDFNELDCYGLVRKFYFHQFSIELEDFGMKYGDGDLRYFVKVNMNFRKYAEAWHKTDKPKYGSVIAMRLDSRMPKIVTHFAIAINEHEMIHTTRNGNSRLEPIARYHNLIEGIYNYEDNNIL